MAYSIGEWVFVVFIGIVLLFTVISNVMVIYCVVKVPKLRTVNNVFICNLAVSDVILAAFVMPQKLHDVSHTEDFFYEGEALCKVVNFFPVFIITSSIYTLVAISFERHRAVTRPSHPVPMTRVKQIIPGIWLFGFLVSLPTLIEYSVNNLSVSREENGTVVMATLVSCGSQHVAPHWRTMDAIFVTLAAYILPLVLMTKNYLHVAYFIWKRGRQTKAGTTTRNLQAFHLFKNRVKLVKLTVILAAIFAVSWLPFFIILMLSRFTGTDASEQAGGLQNLLLIALSTLGTASDVVLYVIFHPNFRRALKEMALCKHPALNSVAEQNVASISKSREESNNKGLNEASA